MIYWLNRFSIWLALGGQMDENAISNGSIILLAIATVAFITACFSKKIKQYFF